MEHQAPFVRLYDLSDLGRAGDEVTIALGEGDRARLAQWAELDEVGTFKAKIALERLSSSRFSYRASLAADIAQACVVTLEPVLSHIAQTFSRELHFVDRAPHQEPRSEALTLGAAEDEAPEAIESLEFDLAGPLLEEFCLAIDPYPRAPGRELRGAEGRGRGAGEPVCRAQGFESPPLGPESRLNRGGLSCSIRPSFYPARTEARQTRDLRRAGLVLFVIGHS
jgi:hypothetical protein